jgi:dihydroneopterin aldolase
MRGRAGRDRVELRGLRVQGTHGVLPAEHEAPQPFEVDLDVWFDMAAAVRTDDLADTVDYAQLAIVVAEVVGGARHYELLEALAGELAAVLLDADDRIDAVAVSLRKLEPPIPLTIDSVGVRVVRRREIDDA